MSRPRSRIGWSGAVVLAAVLAGCGSAGGGGDDDDRCPPGSVIGILPPAARVVAGGAPVTFGGGVANCQAMVSWSLSGPGTLDRTQGVPVVYTPPAAVVATATATLTASAGGLTTSATITIDPAVMLLTGRVVADNGAPVEGVEVRVEATSALTDAQGAFSLSGVSPPYDLTATAPGGQLTSIYPDLRRMDPTLVIFDLEPAFQLSGYVSGALHGGAGFPQPAGHEAGVSFRSAEAAGTCAVQAGHDTFFLTASWFGPSTVTGELHALQWQVDAHGRPASFDGYASRAGVTLTDHGTLGGQDFALGVVAAKAVSGTIVNAANSDVAVISLFAVFGTGAGTRIRILPPPSDPSPFSAPGFQSTFSIPTPAVLGSTIDLVSRQDYVGMAYQEVHRNGLPPDASAVAVEYAGLPVQDRPVGGTTGVGPGTAFSWFSMPDHPVYVVSFRGPAGSPGYDVFTTAQSLVIPTGLPIPPATRYTWRVRGSSAFSTVDDAAGPGGFFAGAPSYRIAQGQAWEFTTAP